ncbi:cysteine desulfurase family protein [uncultured Helcococcus sp.]|uniref:cysteine desulfurase family protein n=1 Tax=uncultured Helcococcus sp. TaxID=1072508 RepID=UPI00288C4796|nr:cysteine desulfurase family protein [uncultured Helcococcus sp.]
MIYFDNASTTKIDKEVKIVMDNAYDKYWANPSSLHRLGFEAEKQITSARKQIANSLSISDKNLFFVPSGTIANNAVLHSFDKKGSNILISQTEHPSIFEAGKNIKAELRIVRVDQDGYADKDDMLSKIDENTSLVSIMHVNNELGSINEINKLAELAKNKNPKLHFHSDGVQAFKKIATDLRNIDFYTISSHKINGPKGISALYIKDLSSFNSLYFGGGQELKLFSGTENLPAILAFAKATELDNNYDNISEINRFLRQEISKIDDVKILSAEENYSPYILNICFKNIGAEILLHYLEMDEIYVSTGSACSKGHDSRVLDAIGVEDSYKGGCIRLSLSKDSTIQEAKIVVDKIKEKVEIIRRIIG